MRLGLARNLLRTKSSLSRVIISSGAFALALAIALKPVLQGMNGFSLASAPKSDFALAIYYPVRAFLDGANPYDQSAYLARYPVRNAFAPYLPSTLLLHLPLGLMPLGTAAFLYLVAEILIILVLAVMSLRASSRKVSTSAVFLIATVILLSRPGRHQIMLGQLTLEAVLATYITLNFAHSVSRISGLGLALTSVKPNYGLPLALLLLMRGDRRPLGYGVLFVLLLNLPVIAILAHRAGGPSRFTQQLATTLGGFQALGPANSPVLSPYRIDVVSLVGRFVGHGPDLAGQVLVALTILSLAGLAIRTVPSDERSSGLAVGIICTAVLLCCYHQHYDLLLLTWPFVSVATGDFPQTLRAPTMRVTRLVLFTFLAFNYTISDTVLNRLHFLAGGSMHFQALIRDPRALALGSLNGLVLLTLFCSFLATAFALPGRVPHRGISEHRKL